MIRYIRTRFISPLILLLSSTPLPSLTKSQKPTSSRYKAPTSVMDYASAYCRLGMRCWHLIGPGEGIVKNFSAMSIRETLAGALYMYLWKRLVFPTVSYGLKHTWHVHTCASSWASGNCPNHLLFTLNFLFYFYAISYHTHQRGRVLPELYYIAKLVGYKITYHRNSTLRTTI